MTPWTVAYQAPLSMGFYRQEHWSGVPIAFSDVYNMEEPKATVGSKLAHLFQEAQTHQLPKVLASRETLGVGFRD